MPYINKLTFDVVFTDVNSDGRPDLIVGYFQSEYPAVFINIPEGNFVEQTAQYLPLSSAGNNIAIIVGDFNNDTHEDLYLENFSKTISCSLQPLRCP